MKIDQARRHDLASSVDNLNIWIRHNPIGDPFDPPRANEDITGAEHPLVCKEYAAARNQEFPGHCSTLSSWAWAER